MSDKYKTPYPGVRYREHKTRKHDGKPDRYFFIRYRLNGKLKEEGLGWASQGWNAKKASITLGDLQKAQKSGEGARTLGEKRQAEHDRIEAERLEKERQIKESLSFSKIFEDRYYPHAKENKSKKASDREEQLFRLWIYPVIREQPLKDINVNDLDGIKRRMLEAGRAKRSINYALDVVRQVFNFSIQRGLFNGKHPIEKGVKFSDRKLNNGRVRFLSNNEADQLLQALGLRSQVVQEQALISLHCGLRASEIFSLTWGDISLETKEPFITVKDSKKNLLRNVPITTPARDMFARKERGGTSELIYPARGDEKADAISDTFERVVDQIGLNKDVTDDRQKVVFHTLRHTYGSWLVQSGVPLYTVKELMGHQNIKTTQRYAHLCNSNFQDAVKRLEKSIEICTQPDTTTIDKCQNSSAQQSYGADP